MVPLILGWLRWGLIAGLAAGIVGYVWHCESVKADRTAFIAKLEVQAEEAERRASDAIKEGIARKERADEDAKRHHGIIASLNRRLRDERARASYVPAAPTGSKRPDRATFDRAELERAIQQLDERVSGLVTEGDQARVDLDVAKRWAQDAAK